ncbi:MAG: hypothetical protein PHI18_06845 [bacterium]|nr:hypothetical protein [bacterium]
MSNCCSPSPDPPPAPAKKHLALPPAWREAAVFGALWGAFEITVGSFLYMTRLPLKGVLLSSLAAGLLVASHMLIRRPWFPLRAALICVALRTLAPDGIRVGLLFALLFQGFNVALFFRLLRSPLAAGLAAGFVAAVASQLQSIITKLVTYGLDFWSLFVALLEKAQSLLHLRLGSEWMVVGVFLLIVGGVGALGGVLGWRLGRTALALRREERGDAS